jgi:hypothetical protein
LYCAKREPAGKNNRKDTSEREISRNLFVNLEIEKVEIGFIA